MNNGLVWRFDVAVIEWLIVLALLVILSVVGTVVTRRSFRTTSKQNGQPGAPTSMSERWHSEKVTTVLESLVSTTEGLSSDE